MAGLLTDDGGGERRGYLGAVGRSVVREEFRDDGVVEGKRLLNHGTGDIIQRWDGTGVDWSPPGACDYLVGKEAVLEGTGARGGTRGRGSYDDGGEHNHCLCEHSPLCNAWLWWKDDVVPEWTCIIRKRDKRKGELGQAVDAVPPWPRHLP